MSEAEQPKNAQIVLGRLSQQDGANMDMDMAGGKVEWTDAGRDNAENWWAANVRTLKFPLAMRGPTFRAWALDPFQISLSW